MRSAGSAGSGSASEIVLAYVATEGRQDMDLACPECVALVGRYKPEKFPTIEEYEAAIARFGEAGPIWESDEEATRAWEEGEPYLAALEASCLERGAVPPQGRGRGLSAYLDQINADLTAARERFEDIPPGTFAEEADYWRARRSIAEAGGIVAGEQGRLEQLG